MEIKHGFALAFAAFGVVLAVIAIWHTVKFNRHDRTDDLRIAIFTAVISFFVFYVALTVAFGEPAGSG